MSDIEQRLAALAARMDQVQKSDQQQKASQQEGQIRMAAAHLQKAVDDKEAALAEAYEDGDGPEIAKAQRELTEAINHRDASLPQLKARLEVANKDDTNLSAWKSKHADWYGVNAEMTRAAHEIDRHIREVGAVAVGSREYFDAVDREMSRRYPDQLSGSPSVWGGGSAPGHGGGRGSGRIEKGVAEGWKRMGIDMDNPKVVERMLKNRERLVRKGILPERPVTGPVVTR